MVHLIYFLISLIFLKFFPCIVPRTFWPIILTKETNTGFPFALANPEKLKTTANCLSYHTEFSMS